MATLPVPLLTANELWQAVQLSSPGALVCDAEGPNAEAETPAYLPGSLQNPAMPIIAVPMTTINLNLYDRDLAAEVIWIVNTRVMFDEGIDTRV